MKSRTSRSLLPLFSCSRIWFRRSTASGALESASVWFWHTRQRSSVASAVTRFSISGSCASAGSANASRTRNLATRTQFANQRFELRAAHFRRERSDVLVADHATLVDDVRLRHAIDAVIDRDAARRVVHRQL